MEPHPKVESYPRRSPERWLRGDPRDGFRGLHRGGGHRKAEAPRANSPGTASASLDRFIRGVEEDQDRLRILMGERRMEPLVS